jgi:hypothetical protein
MSCRATAAVIGLVSEAIRKMASRESGAASSKEAEPYVSTCTSSPDATRVVKPGTDPEAT